MPPLPFAFQSNPARHPSGGVAELINCYAADVGEGQRAKLPIYVSDGLSAWATHTGAGATRLMIGLDATLYVLNERRLSRFDLAGNETLIGGIPSDGPVFAARNRKSPAPQIGIVCDGLFYILASNVLTQINDPDLTQTAIGICFLSGYFVLPCSNGSYFWTAIDEGSTIDALDFASAEANPDGLVGAKARGDELVLVGNRSTEFHRLSGDADAPFVRSAVRNFGCLSAKSICEVAVVTKEGISDTIGWVATDRSGRAAGVILLEGYEARKISPQWVDDLIEADADKSNIEGFTWVRGGHSFFGVTGSTWSVVFDLSTGLWHRRRSYNSDRYAIAHVLDFNGDLIAASRTGGALYKMGPSYLADGSDPLIMTVQSSQVLGEVEVNELKLSVATGVGTLTETNPMISMSWSQDGENWSTERDRALGAAAQSNTIVRWNRMGTNRNDSAGRSFRFRSSAAVVRAIYGAYVNPTAGE